MILNPPAGIELRGENFKDNISEPSVGKEQYSQE